jgi:hypothetical protein
MAKVKEGSGLVLSGKADGRVYVQFNGGTYTRSLPRRSKDSVTPQMLLSQKRFGEVSHFCKKFKFTVIPQIWKAEAVRMSGYAFFMKANTSAFGPDGKLADPKKLKLSTGKLPLPEGMEARRTTAGSSTIVVSWQKDLHLGGVHLKDELMVISAADGHYSEIAGTGIVRMALGGSFELPLLSIAVTHIYLFFGSKDRRDYSESVCFEV